MAFRVSEASAPPSKPHGYGAFAYAYDEALGKRFFSAVSLVLDRYLRKYPALERTHLDLACGTGLTLEYFAELGYRSLGIDISIPMLQQARSRSGNLVACDMRRLGVRGCFSRITCLYDSLNHLLEHEELVAAFRGVAGVMDRDSLFFFDINHPEIYPVIWGNEKPFVSIGPKHELFMATSFSSLRKLALAELRGWASVRGHRIVIDETQTQRSYSERDIVKALHKAGLTPVEVVGFDPFGEADSRRPRVKLFFVVRLR